MNRRSFLGSLSVAPAFAARRVAVPSRFPDMRADYLEEADEIPDFWISTVEGVNRFLDERVKKGSVAEIGRTAGGRGMRCVFHGESRRGTGTTTFSGSLGFGDSAAYRGPDHSKKVYMTMASVHGGEFEGIVGVVNLISVLETGSDLRGEPWPEITEAAGRLDRIILLPITNVDGRERVPLRMMRHRGADPDPHEYMNTGGKKDGSLIGWPDCKEKIPIDFSTVGFPGGYPNDAGVNIQHDDFFRAPQPETRALLDLTTRERPDLILNMHTGTQFIQMLKPLVEPVLMPAFAELYARVHGRLTQERLQPTDDVKAESDSTSRPVAVFNLDSALNFNCGALALVVESPSHNYSTGKRNGEPFFHGPEEIVRAHLLTHQEAMKHLADSGGRSKWAPGKRR